jgi:hypothetical protein
MEFFEVSIEIPEINLGVLGCAGPQTLVVLEFPAMFVLMRLLPLLIFWHGEKGVGLCWLSGVTLENLDDWGNELNEKPWDLKEAGKLDLEKIDKETFDMASVVILVGHDHQMPVP